LKHDKYYQKVPAHLMFVAYLRGIETLIFPFLKFSIPLFVAYLRGIETDMPAAGLKEKDFKD